VSIKRISCLLKVVRKVKAGGKTKRIQKRDRLIDITEKGENRKPIIYKKGGNKKVIFCKRSWELGREATLKVYTMRGEKP